MTVAKQQLIVSNMYSGKAVWLQQCNMTLAKWRDRSEYRMTVIEYYGNG